MLKLVKYFSFLCLFRHLLGHYSMVASHTFFLSADQIHLASTSCTVIPGFTYLILGNRLNFVSTLSSSVDCRGSVFSIRALLSNLQIIRSIFFCFIILRLLFLCCPSACHSSYASSSSSSSASHSSSSTSSSSASSSASSSSASSYSSSYSASASASSAAS